MNNNTRYKAAMAVLWQLSAHAPNKKTKSMIQTMRFKLWDRYENKNKKKK